MRIPLLLALLVGIASAATNNNRAPVYPGSRVVRGTMMTTTTTTTTMPTTTAGVVPGLLRGTRPTPPRWGPVAEPRESVGVLPDGNVAPQPLPTQTTTDGVPSAMPSQNYYVYYYPPDNRGQPSTISSTAVAQPNSVSVWTWSGWNDVVAGVASLAMVAVGGGILYNRYGTEVKTRALRQLQNLTVDDAARMATTVFKALEKYSELNVKPTSP